MTTRDALVHLVSALLNRHALIDSDHFLELSMVVDEATLLLGAINKKAKELEAMR